jgi:zinc D-Ala-D-Ala carboxypeptidase
MDHSRHPLESRGPSWAATSSVARLPAVRLVRAVALGLMLAGLAWWLAGDRVQAGRWGPSAGAAADLPPACAFAEDPAPRSGVDDWARTILDTSYSLGRDYVPPDLVAVGKADIAGRGRVRTAVIADLRALARAAAKADVAISVNSAYRSYADQVASFDSYQAAFGTDEALRSVARPGHSEHQLGTTIDFDGDLGWLAANAWRHGFVMSYPAGASPGRTCYKPEAWHFRYVGRADAAAVRESGLSLREWLWTAPPDR